jgi:hypothetical protein
MIPRSAIKLVARKKARLSPRRDEKTIASKR